MFARLNSLLIAIIVACEPQLCAMHFALIKSLAQTPVTSVCRQTYENYGDTLTDFRERGKISFSCEWELYKGTAPEQKTKRAKIPENSMFSGILILIFLMGSAYEE